LLILIPPTKPLPGPINPDRLMSAAHLPASTIVPDCSMTDIGRIHRPPPFEFVKESEMLVFE
jgi:hypothetical protein